MPRLGNLSTRRLILSLDGSEALLWVLDALAGRRGAAVIVKGEEEPGSTVIAGQRLTTRRLSWGGNRDPSQECFLHQLGPAAGELRVQPNTGSSPHQVFRVDRPGSSLANSTLTPGPRLSTRKLVIADPDTAQALGGEWIDLGQFWVRVSGGSSE